MDNPLTLQEAKDQVTKKYGYKDENDLFEMLGEHTIKSARYSQLFSCLNEAAELYARSKWQESARAVLMAMNGEVDEGDIPEFKP